MTPNREDYLKLLLELGGDTKQIPNKSLVTGLHVSAASVSEMIGKLMREKLATHTPYKGVQLTEKGIKRATFLIRKHRLWEVFLTEKLDFDWNEIHMEAEILEHATSVRLELALEKFLNFPKKCPHGGIIPKANETLTEQEATPLSEMNVGDCVKIVRVIDEKALLDTLTQKKIAIDEKFQIHSQDNHTFILKNESKQVCLSADETNLIFVTKIKETNT